MSKILSFFFVLLATQIHAARAQDNLDPARLALAREVLNLTRAAETIENMAPSMVQQQMQMIESMENSLTAEQKAAVESAVSAFMDSFSQYFPVLMDEMAKLYAAKFSVADLSALKDFYQSDVGRRFIDGGIEIAPQLIQVSQAWSMQYLMPAAQKMGEDLRVAVSGRDN